MIVRQTEPTKRWPSGDDRPIALLDVAPKTLEDRLGLRFEFGTDEQLGDYQLAAVDVDPSEEYWLIHYVDDPTGGLQVHADAEADPSRLDALLDALGLPRSIVLWAPRGSESNDVELGALIRELERLGWSVDHSGETIVVRPPGGEVSIRIAENVDDDVLRSSLHELRTAALAARVA